MRPSGGCVLLGRAGLGAVFESGGLCGSGRGGDQQSIQPGRPRPAQPTLNSRPRQRKVTSTPTLGVEVTFDLLLHGNCNGMAAASSASSSHSALRAAAAAVRTGGAACSTGCRASSSRRPLRPAGQTEREGTVLAENRQWNAPANRGDSPLASRSGPPLGSSPGAVHTAA